MQETLRGHDKELLKTFRTLCYKQNCNLELQKQSDTVHVSLITELSLTEYAKACKLYCEIFHCSTCVVCQRVLIVMNVINEHGYCTLKHAFSIVSPGVQYSAEKARRRLLQIPLVAIRLGDVNKGNSFTILTEYIASVNYTRIGTVINGLLKTSAHTQSRSTMEKSCVKMLLGLAQSDRERECIRYAIYKSSDMSATRARREYGFESMDRLCEQVEDAIEQVRDIRQTIEEIAKVKDEAIKASFGLNVESESDDSSDEEETFIDNDCCSTLKFEEISTICKSVLLESNFNWFQLQEVVDSNFPADSKRILNAIILNLSASNFSKNQDDLILQSHQAYLAAQKDSYCSERTARVVNGDIVTESDSDDPEQYSAIRQ